MATNNNEAEKLNIDSIISRLLEGLWSVAFLLYTLTHFFSKGKSTRKKCPIARMGNKGVMPKVSRDFFESTCIT